MVRDHDMNDDETLEVLARIAILAGKLPGRRIQRIWAGMGEGSRCTLCGHTVDRGEPGYEFDHLGEHGERDGTCALHFRCFAAWNSARERLEAHGQLAPRRPAVNEPAVHPS
jgi:hypothetical protein